MNPTLNYVFVPGAWHGGWSWHPVAHRVRAAGHTVLALTLPGLSLGDDPTALRLTDAIDHIVTSIEDRDLHDVVLVGHSFAGIPIAGAAPRLTPRLAAIGFFSAFIPRPAESMADAMGPDLAGYLRHTVESAPDHTISVDFDTFRTVLMPGSPEAVQRLVHDQLVPQPGGYMLDAQDTVDLRTLEIPITYALAENDLALAAPGAELAARAGVEPIMVPGDHEALLTHPDEIAKVLLTHAPR